MGWGGDRIRPASERRVLERRVLLSCLSAQSIRSLLLPRGSSPDRISWTPRDSIQVSRGCLTRHLLDCCPSCRERWRSAGYGSRRQPTGMFAPIGLGTAERTVGTSAPATQPEAPSLVSLPRRFCSQVALTPEEREQRALYAAILEYEQDHVSPGSWGWVCCFGGLLPLGLPYTPERAQTMWHWSPWVQPWLGRTQGPGHVLQSLLPCRTGPSTGGPSSRRAQGTCR